MKMGVVSCSLAEKAAVRTNRQCKYLQPVKRVVSHLPRQKEDVRCLGEEREECWENLNRRAAVRTWTMSPLPGESGEARF